MLGTRAEYLYFEKLFKVSIQYIHTVSPQELTVRGQHSTRNKYADRDMVNQMTTTFLSCDKMFQMYLKGSRITAPNDKVASEIYKTIGNYLQDWKERSMISINGHVPVENLIALDEFAESCFSTAINEIKQEVKKPVGIPAFMAHLDNRLGFGPNQAPKQEATVSRENYGQFFKAYLARSPFLRGSWE